VLRAVQNLPIEIHGDGTQIRAWCYITDMVDALMLMMKDRRAVGESFNIGNQRAVITIYGLANLIVRLTKSRSAISFVRKDYADIEIRVPSVSKSRDLLGFEAKVDMDEGLLLTAQYYRRLLRKDKKLCRTALD
jgi:UDP-glucose 4-epimerase